MAIDTSLTEPTIVNARCGNGLTVLIEPMPWLRTAAFSLALPAGLQPEPEERGALAGLTCEMVQRGAGRYSSRELVSVQDNLGIERQGSISTSMVSFNCAMPAESLDKALALYAEIVLTPHLPEDQLDDAKQMSLQELRGIDDDPVQRLMIRLRELQYGPRLGRSPYGTVSSIEQTTLRHIRSFYNDHYHGGGAILGIAGRLDPDQVLSRVESLFSPLRNSVPTDQTSPVGTPGYEHIESDLSQTHIGISFDSLPYGHVDYFKRRAAIGILSDGASSRLFDRVREQRGLCYTVSASSHSVRHGGGVFVYAGTTPERAQETLDVTIHELEHFADSIGVDELDRWRVRVESNLIMEQESSVSKASSLVADQFQMGRVVTIREVESIIGSLTVDAIRDQWLNQPPANYRIVTIGQSPLNVP